MHLTDKVALVTGGAHGIGRALVERFLAEGARGVAIVDRDSKTSFELARELGDRAIGLGGDVARERDVASAVKVTEERFGPIDLMVSNAGIGSMAGIEAPDELWQQVWDVNVMAHVYAARAVVPSMVARGEGYVLSTASAAGLLAQIGDAPYSVTKHAAVGFAEWLNITYGDQGVRVSCLCPMGVNTKLLYSGEQSGDPLGDLATRAVTAAGEVLEPAAVADEVLAAIDDERFLILPHPAVLEMYRFKGADYDRWLRGMRRYQRGLLSPDVS